MQMYRLVVNAINSAIGAYGTTINTGVTFNYRQGIDADMINLVQRYECRYRLAHC